MQRVFRLVKHPLFPTPPPFEFFNLCHALSPQQLPPPLLLLPPPHLQLPTSLQLQPPLVSCARQFFGATPNQVFCSAARPAHFTVIFCLINENRFRRFREQEPWNARRGGASMRWRKTSCPGACALCYSNHISPFTLGDNSSRHPQLSVPGFMRFCDYFGTWVFAISGTLTAATSGLDLLGCVVVGSITALGGGTARDMIMGQVRVTDVLLHASQSTFTLGFRADARSGSTNPSTCGYQCLLHSQRSFCGPKFPPQLGLKRMVPPCFGATRLASVHSA